MTGQLLHNPRVYSLPESNGGVVVPVSQTRNIIYAAGSINLTGTTANLQLKGGL